MRTVTIDWGPRPWFLAHRGSPEEAPENSLRGFRRAVERGATGVELDVRLTRDGRLAVVHDADLGRVAGRPDLVVEQCDAAELRAVALWPPRIGPPGRTEPSAPGEPEAGQTIPLLEEVFTALPPGYPVNVELKRDTAPAEKLARRAVRALFGRSRVILSSFDWPLLRACRACPGGRDLALAPLVDAPAEVPAALAAALDLGAAAVHASVAAAGAVLAAVGPGRPRNHPILVYTVNDPNQARALFAQGVAGVFTDRALWLESSRPSS